MHLPRWRGFDEERAISALPKLLGADARKAVLGALHSVLAARGGTSDEGSFGTVESLLQTAPQTAGKTEPADA